MQSIIKLWNSLPQDVAEARSYKWLEKRIKKNSRRIDPWVAIKTHWSGGSLCFGKSINHRLPGARRVLGKDHAIPPLWISSFHSSSWQYQGIGRCFTQLLGVTPGPLVLFGAYLHLTPLEFKEKKNKAEEGEETIPALHILLVGSLVVVLFSLEWTLCCKWQEAMNHKNKIILTLVLSKENKDGSAISSIIYVSTK